MKKGASRKRSKRKNPARRRLLQLAFLGIGFVAFLALFLVPKTEPRRGLPLSRTGKAEAALPRLATEFKAERKTSAARPENPSRPAPPISPAKPEEKAAGLAAIIIDDIGRHTAPVKKLLELGIPITFSILPEQPHSRDLAEAVHAAGQEVMLHMPMEPEKNGYSNPGKSALLLSQSEDEIRKLVRESIEDTPHAEGMNNHMGSLFTKDGEKMHIVMDEIRKAGLYFVDSRTTPQTEAHGVARRMMVKSASRRIFLDHRLDREAIREALRNLIREARKNGEAIAIGHPHSQTISAITEILPEFEAEGVRLVHASRLVH